MLFRNFLGFCLVLSLFAGCAEQSFPEGFTARPAPKSTIAREHMRAEYSREETIYLERFATNSLLELCLTVAPHPERGSTMMGTREEMAWVELRSRGIFSESELKNISEGKITLGMSEMAARCSWGSPTKKIPPKPRPGQTVQYLYESPVFVDQSFYSREGRVVAVQPFGEAEEIERTSELKPETELTAEEAALAAGMVGTGIVITTFEVLGCLFAWC